MKKSAILTFHYPNNMNFGASLQSFAVSKMINKTNKNTELIDCNPTRLNLKQNIIFNLCGKNFIDYCNKFLKVTKKCETLEDLKSLNNEFDAFIVGSDQVWRSKWLQNKLPHYYFDFVDDSKTKIAYAASFGVDFWEGDEELTKKIKPLAQRFDYISVREESGIKICRDTFGVDAVCVLDPTMMIDKKDYQPILDDWRDESHKKKKYIAHMLLDDTRELREESEKIGNYLKSNINHIKGKDIKILGKTITFYNKVSQWLTYVKDAELVITDSFHCTVFSLIFNKKFVVVANPERGTARLENLLGIVGLKERFFTDIKDVLKSGVLDKDIDYVEVEKKLKIHREYSMNFLKKALGEVNE
ncbi:polysaccharide pyruvyl transferase family protein [Cetobacterium sp.]|uniref:polysaccharide pyruvyl transferase family protein n=1 Tax=Cetobacterium sp. TaxID=2071632 RepID=UPI002FC95744